VRAQDLVTPARFGGAGRGSTWLVALASFTLVFCLIAIGAHPRVQVALHALLATVAGTSPAAP
jgi:hypothetical protein